MARPALGALVREGTREGVVVGHPGRGNMVDVRFRDVTFVERRDAERLSVRPEYEAGEEQLRSVTEGVYESLVKRELGVKTFKDRKGARADVKALDKGTLTREQLSALYGRARAIAVSQGRKYGDLTSGSLARTGERMLPTATGRALSALRYGADALCEKPRIRAASDMGQGDTGPPRGFPAGCKLVAYRERTRLRRGARADLGDDDRPRFRGSARTTSRPRVALSLVLFPCHRLDVTCVVVVWVVVDMAGFVVVRIKILGVARCGCLSAARYQPITMPCEKHESGNQETAILAIGEAEMN
jgi:hypothetical protein